MARDNELIEVDILGCDCQGCEEDEDGRSEEEIFAEIKACDEQPESVLLTDQMFEWNSPNNVDKGDE